MNYQRQELLRIVPHARTLRKARIQVQQMVTYGDSLQHIRSYLSRYFRWWSNTVDDWEIEELMIQFLTACWDIKPFAYVAGLLSQRLKQSGTVVLNHDLILEGQLICATVA